jgi:hypothetical protein
VNEHFEHSSLRLIAKKKTLTMLRQYASHRARADPRVFKLIAAPEHSNTPQALDHGDSEPNLGQLRH